MKVLHRFDERDEWAEINVSETSVVAHELRTSERFSDEVGNDYRRIEVGS